VTPLFSQLWYGLRSLGRSPYSVLFPCDAARARLAGFMHSVGGEIVVIQLERRPLGRVDG
jgi:hypothetical protein